MKLKNPEDENDFDIDAILQNLALKFMTKAAQRQYNIWIILNTASICNLAENNNLKVNWDDLSAYTKKIADIMGENLDKQTEDSQINKILLKFLEEAYPDIKFNIEDVRKDKERALERCPIMEFRDILFKKDFEKW